MNQPKINLFDEEKSRKEKIKEFFNRVHIVDKVILISLIILIGAFLIYKSLK